MKKPLKGITELWDWGKILILYTAVVVTLILVAVVVK